MGTEQLTPSEVIEMYYPDTKKLMGYLLYLEKMSGKSVSNTFNQDGLSEHSLTFPVYDGNLMRFIKDAEQTVFMDRNYRYVYTRYRIKTLDDELDMIKKCTILQMDVLGGILSKYVLGGRKNGTVLSEGAQNGVYLEVIKKADELIRFWESDRA